MEEKGVSKNTTTAWNELIKELEEIDPQLELQHKIQEWQKDEELSQEKVEKRQRRKLKKEKENKVILEPQDQRLTKIAKKQHKENWNNTK